MKCRQCCLPTNVFAQQTTAMRLCGFLANLLLQSFWGDLLTYRVSNDHIITISCFSSVLQLLYPWLSDCQPASCGQLRAKNNSEKACGKL